jgi:hypothetical protein
MGTISVIRVTGMIGAGGAVEYTSAHRWREALGICHSLEVIPSALGDVGE